ncbi:MAG: hypothetical protein Ta2E_10010 [Mycoplasmoidaceae bacterium]|nr:MAG: hypothetical protein Ta2E_10010 [Mycoplasmoidaceae bacterium]
MAFFMMKEEVGEFDNARGEMNQICCRNNKFDYKIWKKLRMQANVFVNLCFPRLFGWRKNIFI